MQETKEMKETELEIIKTFSEWIAFSGTRSGSPLKSRADVYPLIQLPNYDEILKGKKDISKVEFEEWHQRNSELISSQNTKRKMPIGWSAKLINLYLKSMVYVAKVGRPNLIELTHSEVRIKNIQTYAQYKVIIKGMEKIASGEKMKLIEVEKYWKGTIFKKNK
jgi:hypothetical protein